MLNSEYAQERPVVNSNRLTPEQYGSLFPESAPTPGDAQSTPSRPRPERPKDDRPWWTRRRVTIPVFVVFAGFIVFIAVSLIGIALGPEQDDVAIEPEVLPAVQVREPSQQPADTVDSGFGKALRSPSTTIPPGVQREMSDEEIAIALAALDQAVVSSELIAPVPYTRSDYTTGWGDADGDCFSDRHEILLERSTAPTETAGCQVTAGQWTDPYDGAVYTDPSLVTIDHLVPLAAAHVAGGWAWDEQTKQAFAADITYRQAHVPVGQSTNEAKGDSEPHEWRPENAAAWCGYAVDWVSVKTRWELSYSTPEVAAIREMLDTCEPSAGAPPATTVPLADGR